MSRIDKLNIMGIRSFPQGRGETISLYSPLTLIVGVNGSGKTTIVECLKYATTGILPPNTKVGGAFIHDPKLSGDRDVLAQVKMQFKNHQGARMVVTRSLQLSVKKNSRSMKTLEGNLLIDRHGERSTISSRVAELDTIVPVYLGTTPAILDNVIFCHQEDSLWPLGTPLDLKKKFDEIFQAEKYTKAIENLTKIRKSQVEELAKQKIHQDHAKEDKDRANKATRRSVKLSDEIEELRAKCNELQEKMDRAQQLADQLWKDSESYAIIVGRLEGLRTEADSKKRTIRDLKVHLKEVDQSDDWLEQTLGEFETMIRRLEEDRDSKKDQWLKLKEDVTDLRDQLKQKTSEEGKYEQDKETHERQLERRDCLIKEAALRHQLRGYDDLSDAGLVEDFLHKIRKLFKGQSGALEQARTTASSEKQDALNMKNQLSERRSALQHVKDEARNQISLFEREVSEYRGSVDAIPIDEGGVAVLESRIDDMSKTLQNARELSQGAGWDQQLKDTNAQLRSQEDKAAQLNSELIDGTKRAGEAAKLSHLKQELKEKQRSLHTLLNAHGNHIKDLIGDAWTPSNIEREFQKCLDNTNSEVRDAERSRDSILRELEQTQFKHKSTSDDIAQKKAQATCDEQAVRMAIDDDVTAYDEAFSDVQKKVDFARDESKGLGAMADYFQKCLDVLEERTMCRTCSRPFKNLNDPALLQMKKKMQSLISKTDVDARNADLPAAEAEYKRINDAGIAHANWKKLTQDTLPQLKEDLNTLVRQRESLVTKVEGYDCIVEQKRTVQREVESLSRTVTSINKIQSEIVAYTGQIDDLTGKQSQLSNLKTLEEIQDEMGTVSEDIRKTKMAIAQLTVDRDSSKSQIHQLELGLRDLKSELGEAKSQLERKASLIARVEESRSLTRKQRDIIDKADLDIESLGPEIDAAQVKYDAVARGWEDEIGVLSRNANQLSETVNELNLASGEIKSYLDRDSVNRLAKVRREIKSLEKDLSDVDVLQTQLGREINKMEERLHDSDNTKRQYSDNLRCRQESRALIFLEEEITDLESKNAHVDRDRFQEESRRATRDYQKYAGQRQGFLGEMKSKDYQLEELIKDFETDFKDAPKRWKEAHIKVETTKAAIADLSIYASALDNAIIEFHSLRMREVNNIIEDLWRKTYRGSDVDEIRIKSDTETASSNTRKNYNYRVVMVKQGVEMDMRGRCSAGQKVLASIIIRLALADVFSQDCGLIALDEPTTNLDRDNIESLAKALHDIIKEREKQANFQLVVITHDEDFLRNMGCSEFAEHYYRVSRDANADSIIERQHINEVEK